MKQPDASLWPSAAASRFPSVVLEVGCSESIQQVRIDMRLWIEHCDDIQLGILLSIDPLVQPNPALPRITVELWRSFQVMAPCTAAHRQRVGHRVWQADWTLAASRLYVLLPDTFGYDSMEAGYLWQLSMNVTVKNCPLQITYLQQRVLQSVTEIL
jgi:hypothetical protein